MSLSRSWSCLPAARREFSTSSCARATWGFIGLGQMGYPMAKNLRAKIPATDTIVIHDVNRDTLKRFVAEAEVARASCRSAERGGRVEVADSPRRIGERSDTIITVLPETSHVQGIISEIIRHPRPLAPPIQERSFIDCSTIDPHASRSIAHDVRLARQGVFVDAPMSGGVVGARAAMLTFMLGAPPELVSRIKRTLLLMGRSVHHCGDQGAGLSAKLANNYLLAIINLATAEALNLGSKYGLDPKVLTDLINASTGRNWCSEVNNPVPGVRQSAPASQGYKGGYGVRLMKKDLMLAIDAARKSGARLQLHETALAVYEALSSDERYRQGDFSIVYRYLIEIDEEPS